MTLPYRDRVLGCWLGKSIGGTLGLPAEGAMERLHYTFYDPIPTVAPPNDDLELQLVWLDMLERKPVPQQHDFATAWLENIHYMWDEYGRCRWNLRRGVPLSQVGTLENAFTSGMGSPIRSEIWACVFPGDTQSAAYYAAMDASLDHGAEGIAGEVLFASMQSQVAGGHSIDAALQHGLAFLPGDLETSRAIALVRECHASRVEAWECRESLLKAHGSENFTHAPLNVALTIWALLYGNGNFEQSILLAVNGGYDTDCTAATVGATLGLQIGAAAIPERWSQPIGSSVFVGAGIQQIKPPTTLEELTERTIGLLDKVEARAWDPAWLNNPSAELELRGLPGTIQLNPLGGADPVDWANGELPPAVKAAGGAEWLWDNRSAGAREIVCLAREGARLYVNGELALDCLPGLPYVPAVHRCPPGSRVRIKPGVGTHSMRLELNKRADRQDATLILAYPNFHICPWTADELPLPANLPATGRYGQLDD